ncbi:MAG: hypothetical protein COA79_03645 [Planctomycetota bacterium]|nr:MAG: hypothetical protein COA79_03645 [Planctomycetota bacterium]
MKEITTRTQDLFNAGLESIKYRASLSSTGGIVESDDRLDRKNYLYADRCWLRNYHIEPLLYVGENEMVLNNLNYWKKSFEDNGGKNFFHTYHFKTAESLSKQEQIDNNAHFIHHVYYTWLSLGEGQWLNELKEIIKTCANYLISRYDDKYQLLSGQEERVVEGIAFPHCFSFYINRVCVSALLRAADLLKDDVSLEQVKEWQTKANQITQGIENHLFDEKKEVYAYLKFTDDADHELAGKLSHDQSWGSLWAYIHNEEFDEKDSKTVHNRLKDLWKVDEQLPNIICQKPPEHIKKLMQDGYDHPEFQYSGVGVCPAANAVAAWIMHKLDDNLSMANELWNGVFEVRGDRNILPEHVNTIHPGAMKDYTLWPDEKSIVDSGNLMHLTMVMTMSCRLGKIDDSL